MQTRLRTSTPFAVVLVLALAQSPHIARAAWTPNGVPVCTVTGTQFESAITSDWLNGAIIAWADRRFVAVDIYAQRIDASGNALWSGGGIAVSSATSGQGNPRLIPDFANGAVVIWEDRRSNHTGGNGNIYAQRVDSQGIRLWTPGEVALGITAGDSKDVSVITDAHNGVHFPNAYLVAWTEVVTTSPPTGEQIWIQHVDLNGGSLWTSPGVLGVLVAGIPGPSVGHKGPVAMTSDGVGTIQVPKGAVLTWADKRDDAGDIYARRVNADGVPQWTADGIGVCTSTGTQQNPDIANVGSDQVVLVWDDARDGQADIYAQKLNSAGTAAWLAGGLPVCRALGAQTTPAILNDLAGGAFIAWSDARDGEQRIYGQRIDANGTPLWAVDGVLLCAASAGVDNPVIKSDGAGGFIVAWSDHRFVDPGNVYAQRVDANGNILWDPNGAPLCVSAGMQHRPGITAVAGNGIIAAWDDERSGALDVYANMVAGNGGASDAPAVSVGASTLLTLASGNPTRGAARFELQLPSARSVAMDVRDVAGRRVRSISNGWLGAGMHTLIWDGADESGVKVGSGVYFVRLTAGEESRTSRVVVVR